MTGDTMAQPRKERRQQQAEELCAATIRSFTRRPQLRYRGHRLELNGRLLPIRAPHLHVDVDEDDMHSFRGAADGAALRIVHSDPELHRSLMPETPVEQAVFEMLEQLRVESLVGNEYPGMRRNLSHRFAQWSIRFQSSAMIDNQIGLLVYTIAQITWSRLTGNPIEEPIELLIEGQRALLAKRIGLFLVGLSRERHNQHAFAQHALSIAGVAADIVDSISKARGQEEGEKDNGDDQQSDFDLLLDLEEDVSETLSAGIQPQVRTAKQLADQLASYRIYTSEYDREVNATALVREEQLKEFRQILDRRVRAQGINVPRLSRRLSRLLTLPQRSGWDFGHEEGYLDAGRLSQIVTSPAERRVFRRERMQPHAYSQVSFLIDNSGSMKTHIESVAMLVDVLVRALDQIGVRTEVLGFTTNAWNGGKPFKDWQRRGRPPHPGRLNELCHIVYKDAATSWRRGRAGLAAMLKPSLFREGVDGEALLWAARRLNASGSRRRVLIVISDGCPMDGATNRTNTPDYLDHHLQQVVALVAHRREIELYALGVGLDLSNYYPDNLALDISRSLDNAVFEEILQLIARKRRLRGLA